MNRRSDLFLLFAALASLLSGCIVVHEEQRETVAINGNQLAGSSIPPGQKINVALKDGTVFSAAFVELSRTELVTRRRGTFAMEDIHTPLSNVSAVSYYRVVGTRTERVDLPFP